MHGLPRRYAPPSGCSQVLPRLSDCNSPRALPSNSPSSLFASSHRHDHLHFGIQPENSEPLRPWRFINRSPQLCSSADSNTEATGRVFWVILRHRRSPQRRKGSRSTHPSMAARQATRRCRRWPAKSVLGEAGSRGTHPIQGIHERSRTGHADRECLSTRLAKRHPRSRSGIRRASAERRNALPSKEPHGQC